MLEENALDTLGSLLCVRTSYEMKIQWANSHSFIQQIFFKKVQVGQKLS